MVRPATSRKVRADKVMGLSSTTQTNGWLSTPSANTSLGHTQTAPYP